MTDPNVCWLNTRKESTSGVFNYSGDESITYRSPSLFPVLFVNLAAAAYWHVAKLLAPPFLKISHGRKHSHCMSLPLHSDLYYPSTLPMKLAQKRSPSRGSKRSKGSHTNMMSFTLSNILSATRPHTPRSVSAGLVGVPMLWLHETVRRASPDGDIATLFIPFHVGTCVVVQREESTVSDTCDMETNKTHASIRVETQFSNPFHRHNLNENIAL